jgi:hypothetical protein
MLNKNNQKVAISTFIVIKIETKVYDIDNKI